MIKLTVYIAVSCLLLQFLTLPVQSEILNYDNEDCIVDASLDPREDGNYVDCNTPESIAENRTRCCDVEGEKGCCTNETKNMIMVTIGTTIGFCTAGIMTACFVVFWCNPETCPCLKKCPCKCCHRGTDEFTEMTNLTDDVQKIAAVNQTYVRESNFNDTYAPPEKYDMPEELKQDIQDDFWGTSNQASTF